MSTYYPIDTSKLLQKDFPVEIANHREMCELLNEPSYSSNTSSIKTKEKNWQRFFRFEKVRRAYVIYEVYDSPLPIPFRANDFYSPRVWRGIAYALRCKGSNSDVFTWTHLLSVCGFVGLDYGNDAWLKKYAFDCKYGYREAEYHLYIIEDHVREFSRKRLKNCLETLSDGGYIQHEETTRIVTTDGERPATPEEQTLYEKIIEDYLSEEGHSYLNRYDWDPRGKLVKLIEEKMGIADLKRIRKAHRIQLLHDPFEHDDDFEAEGNAFEAILSINERSLSYVNGKAESDVNKSTSSYIDWSFGYDHHGAVTIAPEKGRKARIADRLTLTLMYVSFDPRYYPDGKPLDPRQANWHKWDRWCKSHP